jgi:hypothetical protein
MSGERESPRHVNAGDGNAGDGCPDTTGGGPVERDLPAELRPFEAALASLSPERDRLDYDLIMFRAGHRSAAVAGRRVSRASSLVMPTALLGMTAAAATLLVMLLSRPVVERVEIVRIPVAEPAIGSERPPQPAWDAMSPGRPEEDSSAHRNWYAADVPYPDRSSRLDRLPGRTMSLEVFDRLLRQGADPWARPVATPSGSIQRVEPPLPYLEQLRDFLAEGADS